MVTASKSVGTLTGMAIDLIWEPEGIYRRYHGDVTILERRQSLELICADPRFDGLNYTITDYLDVRTYEISPEATMEIAALHLGPLFTNPRIVIAAVVTDPRIIKAIEHFIGLGLVSVPYRIFSSVQDARRWIDEEPPRVAMRRRRL